MNRILSIARLLTLGRNDALVWPVAILGFTFAVNLLVFANIPSDALDSDPVSGALASIYITSLAFGAVAVNQHFPFALGMGVTRREFTAGLALFGLVQVLVYSTLLVILQAIEDATNGWGLRLRFFGLGFVDDHSVPVQFAIYAVPLMAMTLIGIAAGALYLRWRANGLMTATTLLLLLAGGATALIGRAGKWPAVGHWLTNTSLVSLTAVWPLVLVALLATGSWLSLRRATL
ncbi:hypothetical protein ACPPVO_48625 [Dactylosporangium sp. McL0621]|uniref:hypothetical protein n=1 Tax=Dactylosporangium sp. McL0621 TaxID=3415678 RepID=UPI003CF94F67